MPNLNILGHEIELHVLNILVSSVNHGNIASLKLVVLILYFGDKTFVRQVLMLSGFPYFWTFTFDNLKVPFDQINQQYHQ